MKSLLMFGLSVFLISAAANAKPLSGNLNDLEQIARDVVTNRTFIFGGKPVTSKVLSIESVDLNSLSCEQNERLGPVCVAQLSPKYSCEYNAVSVAFFYDRGDEITIGVDFIGSPQNCN